MEVHVMEVFDIFLDLNYYYPGLELDPFLLATFQVISFFLFFLGMRFFWRYTSSCFSCYSVQNRYISSNHYLFWFLCFWLSNNFFPLVSLFVFMYSLGHFYFATNWFQNFLLCFFFLIAWYSEFLCASSSSLAIVFFFLLYRYALKVYPSSIKWYQKRFMWFHVLTFNILFMKFL